MKALFPTRTFQEALKTLIAGDAVTIRYLKANIREFDELLPRQPALDAVLAWKDRMKIPDRDWNYTMDVFTLANGLSVYYLNKRKKEINTEMLPESTGGTGFELPLLKYMRWVLAHFPPSTRDLIVKIAFDGATVTSGKRLKQEIGTFDFLVDGLDLAAAKSIDNSHQFIIYLGGEEREELEQELMNTIKVVDELVEKKTLTIGDVEYNIEPVLVCDMACLVKVMGLYNVFCPNSKWKCIWCLVNETELFNFTIESWLLRDLTVMRELGKLAEVKQSEGAKSTFAREHYGVRNQPLFKVALDHIVPCMLHCFMGIMRKLLELLVEEVFHRRRLQQRFEEIFTSLHLKLPKQEKKKARTLVERVKKARFGRPDFLRILENRKLFLDCLAEEANTERRRCKLAQTISLWEDFAMLTSLTAEPKVQITEKRWMKLSQPFGERYTTTD